MVPIVSAIGTAFKGIEKKGLKGLEIGGKIETSRPQHC